MINTGSAVNKGDKAMKRWTEHRGRATYQVTEDTCFVCGEFTRVARIIARDDGKAITDDMARYETGTDCRH